MLNRRGFLHGLSTLGFGSMAAGSTSFSPYAYAQMPTLADHKSLVCVFLYGGNDSWNTLVPYSQAEYRAYAQSRGLGQTWGLALERSQLLPITSDAEGSDGTAYAFNPNLRALQPLYDNGRLAIIPSVGPLLEPTTKEQYVDANRTGHRIPVQLFSHNNQQDQWQSLNDGTDGRTGWGGRMVDQYESANPAGSLPTALAVGTQSLLTTGNRSVPLVLGYSGEADLPLITWGAKSSVRSQILHYIFTSSSELSSIYGRAYGAANRRTLRYTEVLGRTLESAPNISYLPDSLPAGAGLKQQLRSVAKLIAMREHLGMPRQLFFVSMGGFDNHDALMTDHPLLLRELGDAMQSFQGAMEELNVAKSVTLFTSSDFGRTLTSNGDGSDHGWAGLKFVMGGSVRGRRMYGSYPVLELDSESEIGSGIFIPEYSADQYAATLARWFGVPDDLLPGIAPNIQNFSVRDLEFLA